MTKAARQVQMNEFKPTKGSIFISHPHKDRRFARKLAENLRDAERTVWIDSDIRAGENWRPAIEAALRAASEVFLVLSPATKKSDFTLSEADRAKKLGTPVVPLIARRCEIPLGYTEKQCVDCTSRKKYEAWLAKHLKVKKNVPIKISPYERFLIWHRGLIALTTLAIVVVAGLCLYWQFSPSMTYATVLGDTIRTDKIPPVIRLQLENHGGRPSTVESGYRLKFGGDRPVIDGDLDVFDTPPITTVPGHDRVTVRLYRRQPFETKTTKNGLHYTWQQIEPLIKKDDLTLEVRIKEWNKTAETRTPQIAATRISNFLAYTIPTEP